MKKGVGVGCGGQVSFILFMHSDALIETGAQLHNLRLGIAKLMRLIGTELTRKSHLTGFSERRGILRNRRLEVVGLGEEHF